jgi:hypothetical protein
MNKSSKLLKSGVGNAHALKHNGQYEAAGLLPARTGG